MSIPQNSYNCPMRPQLNTYQNLPQEALFQPHYGGHFMHCFSNIGSPNMQSSNFSHNTTSSPNVSGASEKSLHSRDEDIEHTSPSKKKKTSKRPNNKIWSSHNDDLLIPFLAEQVKKGMKVDKKFKWPVFVAASRYINSLRSRYMNMVTSKELSRNGWDAETNTATMDHVTYNAWAEKNKKLKDYVNKLLKWFNELSKIIRVDFATGSFSRSVWEEAPRSQSSPQINILDEDETPVGVTEVESDEGRQTTHAKISSTN